MVKLFAEVKSRSEKGKYYSTYIEVNKNHEIISFGCTCLWGSFFGWSKKNGQGTKPCWHAQRLINRYKKAREVTDDKKSKSSS